MILYGSTLSPFVRKIAVVCAEKGIAYENVVSRFDNPDPGFLEASPLKKIPAIKDGDYVLADSSAIAHYLDAKYPETPLIPADPEQRGKVVYFDEWADTWFIACMVPIFFNRIVAPRFLGRPGDQDAADAAEKNDLPGRLARFESIAPYAGGFLVADTLTLAGIAVASPFVNHGHLGLSLDAYPRTKAYLATIHARPSFAALIERENAFLAATAPAAA